MNKLPIKTRAQIINLLCEGMSMRSVSRLTGCSINTITKLLENAGRACMDYHHRTVVNVPSKKVQCDEVWSFVYAKQKNIPHGMTGTSVGDCWTWTAIDADNKMLLSFFVGSRDLESAKAFMFDLASRVTGRIQLTTDGYKPYLKAVEQAFNYDIDYALLIKKYDSPPQETANVRYSPATVTGIEKTKICGNPDKRDVSTSYVERQNLTMRMSMRRFTRLTNGYSKKIENHAHMVAIYTVYYNFCRVHHSLRVTPAMEAGLTDEILTFENIVEITDTYLQKENN